jgi:Uma2 family endonuclease
MPLHQENRYTADEYFTLTPQTSERTELIGGKIVTQTASGVIHQDIAGGIYAEINI